MGGVVRCLTPPGAYECSLDEVIKDLICDDHYSGHALSKNKFTVSLSVFL